MTTEATPSDLVNELAHALQHLYAARRIALRVDGGVLNLSEVVYAIENAGRALGEGYGAARLMAEGQTLAWEFPNGEMAPPVPSPRQVFYLRDIARKEALGGHSARPCGETRVDGAPCRAQALTFTDRAVCFSHATAEERALNQSLRAQYLRSTVRGGM